MTASAKIRVLFVHHGPIATDGAFVSLYELLQALDCNIYEPVVVLPKAGSASEKITALGIKVCYAYPLPVFHHIVYEDSAGIRLTNVVGLLKLMVSLLPAWSLWPVLREQRPQLVHLNGIRYTSAALAAWLNRIPVIWHVREMPADGLFGLRKRLLHFLIKTLSDAVILISQYQALALPGLAQALVVHNPVDTKRFDRASVDCQYLETEFAYFAGRRKILYVGYISQPKGLEDLVEAMPLVLEELPDVCFLLVGQANSSAFMEKLQERITSLGFEDKVVFTGHRDDVPALVKFSDLVVFPSRLKAIGRSVLEAAAMAKPAVATVEQKLSDVIIEGVTGRLALPYNPEDLAQAMVSILSDPTVARQMGQAAYRYLGSHCSTEDHARFMEQIYQAVLAGNVRELAAGQRLINVL